jgi:hypothetical protein
VCCGTKRLTHIACPSDCAWLVSAREHPPAIAVRRQQRDVGFFLQLVRDFNERQSQLFLLISTFLVRYEPPELQPVIDDDLAEAMGALAATYETAIRGVIYEHRPASLPAERLVAALKPMLTEAGKGGGTSFERDAAAVLRRIEAAVREVRTGDPENRRAFLDLVGRLVRKGDDEASKPTTGAEQPRLIVP